MRRARTALALARRPSSAAMEGEGGGGGAAAAAAAGAAAAAAFTASSKLRVAARAALVAAGSLRPGRAAAEAGLHTSSRATATARRRWLATLKRRGRPCRALGAPGEAAAAAAAAASLSRPAQAVLGPASAAAAAAEVEGSRIWRRRIERRDEKAEGCAGGRWVFRHARLVFQSSDASKLCGETAGGVCVCVCVCAREVRERENKGRAARLFASRSPRNAKKGRSGPSRTCHPPRCVVRLSRAGSHEETEAIVRVCAHARGEWRAVAMGWGGVGGSAATPTPESSGAPLSHLGLRVNPPVPPSPPHHALGDTGKKAGPG